MENVLKLEFFLEGISYKVSNNKINYYTAINKDQNRKEDEYGHILLLHKLMNQIPYQ